jgi:benzoyl-CoA reductase/2-hydroxyglutaryl-CoA dehydratase subunit BcrC/BadD/HgdB
MTMSNDKMVSLEEIRVGLTKAKEYKVDGIVSEIVRFCTYNGWDKFDLKKQMEQRGIPILELDVEYGEDWSGQMRTRVEAFLEMVQH